MRKILLVFTIFLFNTHQVNAQSLGEALNQMKKATDAIQGLGKTDSSAGAQNSQPAQPTPTTAAPVSQTQGYVASESKNYRAVVRCEYNASTPDMSGAVKDALKIYASGDANAFTGFMSGIKKYCSIVDSKLTVELMKKAQLVTKRGDTDYVLANISGGMQTFRTGTGSSTVLPVWWIVGVVGN